MSHLQLDAAGNQIQLDPGMGMGMMGLVGMNSPASGMTGGDAPPGLRNPSFGGGNGNNSPHMMFPVDGPAFISPPSFSRGGSGGNGGSGGKQQMTYGAAAPPPMLNLGQLGFGVLPQRQQQQQQLLQQQLQMLRPPPLPGQGGNVGPTAMAPPPANVGGAHVCVLAYLLSSNGATV
jgi:hypothetical protein